MTPIDKPRIPNEPFMVQLMASTLKCLPHRGGGDALMVEMDLDGLGEGQEVSLVCCVDAWSKERRGGR